MPQPLSNQLAGIVHGSTPSGGLTLNQLLVQTQGRGLYLLVIFLCIPFVIPLSLPGLSTVMGSIILFLACSLALGRQPQLPHFLGDRRLPRQLQDPMLAGGSCFLRLIEKVVKPRRSQWMAWPPVHLANCCILALLALLLALPLPAPPFFFTNSVPSYGIIVLAASMMEEDGVLVWCGYVLAVANLVFFGLLAGLIFEFLTRVITHMHDSRAAA